MSALREEVRAILREEMAALRQEVRSPAHAVEAVQITSSAELNRFARNLVARAASPDFAQQVASGQISFELVETRPMLHPVASAPRQDKSTVLDKPLITERDIAELAGTDRVLRIVKQSRLTPLARDEARRKGIRIERIER